MIRTRSEGGDGEAFALLLKFPLVVSYRIVGACWARIFDGV